MAINLTTLTIHENGNEQVFPNIAALWAALQQKLNNNNFVEWQVTC